MPRDPYSGVIEAAVIEVGQASLPAARAADLEELPIGTPTSIERFDPHASRHNQVPLQVGSTVKHYELLRRLGEGGMGAVYLARDTTLGRLVAIKVLQMRSGPSAERFLIEAQATARCRHDNIVVLHEVDKLHGYLYMVLEYLEGRTLREWMVQRERLVEVEVEASAQPRPSHGLVSPNLAVELTLPVVRALACAHQLGIVHRDLKPENIFLTDAGRVVVLDFGIAKRVEANDIAALDAAVRPLEPGARLTQDGALLGTLPYMSPEQLRSEDIDGRSDLWAVGILLYELVTGAHPLSHCSVMELLDIGDSEEPIPSVRDQRPDIGALGAIIDRCLLKPRDKRYRSADELVAALEALARDGVAHAHRPRDAGGVVRGLDAVTPVRARRWRPPLALAMVCVGIAAAAVFAVGPLGDRGGDRPRTAMTARRIVLLAVDPTALLERDRWLAAVVQRLIADELIEAWGLDVELGSSARPSPDTLVVAAGLARDPSGRLRLALDGGVLEATSTRELAIAAAARLVTGHVPEAARHPTPADLAGVGAHDIEAWRLWRRAEHETLQMRWVRARNLCQQALARDPEFPIASLELALSYANEDAVGAKELMHAIELMKRVPVRPLWHLAVSGALQLKAGDEEGAARTAEQLLRLDLTPREQLWIELRWDMARIFRAAPPAVMIPRLTLVTELHPDHAAAFKLLADLYLGPDQPTAATLALRYATRAAELAPEDVAAHALYAMALLNAGRPGEARARADELARFDPEDKRLAEGQLFSLHMALGELDEAERDAQRQLTGSAGERAQGAANLAMIDLYWGRFASGLRGLVASADALDATGGTEGAARLRTLAGRQAWIYGDRAGALAALERVAAGRTHFAPVARVLSLVLAGKLDDARVSATALADGSIERASMALAIADAGHDAAGVLAAFEQIEKLSTAIEQLFTVADALERSGRLDEAAAMFERLATDRLAWSEPIAATRAWARLGHLRERAGDTAGARVAFAEVVRRWGHATARTPELDDARRRLRTLQVR